MSKTNKKTLTANDFVKLTGFKREAVKAKKDNTFEIRCAYYYKMNNTPDLWANKVMEKIEHLGFKLVSSYDEYKAWPGQSYFVAIVQFVDGN